jgi:hypothetical protein
MPSGTERNVAFPAASVNVVASTRYPLPTLRLSSTHAPTMADLAPSVLAEYVYVTENVPDAAAGAADVSARAGSDADGVRSTAAGKKSRGAGASGAPLSSSWGKVKDNVSASSSAAAILVLISHPN